MPTTHFGGSILYFPPSNCNITDGNNILDTPIVKYYNDLLGRQSSERGKDEVPNFVYYIKNHFYVIHKVWNFFPEISAKIFS